MLAHELRNPLAADRQRRRRSCGCRSRRRSTCEWAQEVIDRQVEHLARLIDDLLDVSRITRGKIELRKEPVDLAARSSAAPSRRSGR